MSTGSTAQTQSQGPAQSQSQTQGTSGPSLFEDYALHPKAWDELFAGASRSHDFCRVLFDRLGGLDVRDFLDKRTSADLAFINNGITFSVYSDRRGTEKIFPFDLIPRPVHGGEWDNLENGLIQRIRALNIFLDDVYHDGRILKEGIIPEDLVVQSKGYRPEMIGFSPPGKQYLHVVGTDLIRDRDGQFLVLEDNGRSPSGVSYVLENRVVMKKIFPQLFQQCRVRRVEDYPRRLREALSSVAPDGVEEPTIVLLSPGQYNSAYFEHCFLARHMGVELVFGQDLFVHDDKVYLHTTRGPQRVDVIYRRIDDAFLDPKAFRPDSMLGVPNLMRAYKAGNVTLANAVGTGVSDDKAIYPFVEDMIRFYLSEEPILKNVPTYICARPDDLKYTLDHLPELVVKAVNESGGYGMLMGPWATSAQIAEFAEKLRENPRNYVAQPVVTLSTSPTWTDDEGLAPRHVDLRPYIVSGTSTWVLPGGLTRTALVKGSLVVNSSQGGGSKDTWVMENGR
ncbi:circularly permuted type 2 ATP-grasp protein [Aquisphaera insulae]|uniref:circularly permuted type 2 ATP-grasp protein n=1 Tax=Aquisphaera insulae TaxID=2712864 RepID=UPI0013ECB9A8|nr:circularly permuted type 2 ATP-grasp protein [Aquisphaera insulae]